MGYGIRLSAARGAALCALCWLSCALLGCGGATTATGKPTATAEAPAAPPPPALPARAVDAVPPDADQVLLLDLEQLRASRELSKTLTWLDAVPCLDSVRVGAAAASALRFVLTTRSQAPDTDLALLVELRSGHATAAEALLWALPGAGEGRATHHREGRDGRYDRLQLGPWSAVALQPRLVLLGRTPRVQAIQALFDDPTRGPRTDHWGEGRLDAFRPGDARVLVWDSAQVPELAARQLGGLLGGRAAGAVAGARSVGVLERSPVALRVEAEMSSPAAAQSLRNTLHSRLRSASLILRLMGLPLDKRLESKQNGATLRLDLPLSASEARRLLGFAEASWPSLARSICERPSAQSLPAASP